MKTPLLLLFLAFCLQQQSLHAQSQFTGWIASFNTIKLGKKTSFHNDMHWRSTDRLHHMQTLLLRGGLNVHLSPRSTVTAGYAFIQNRRTSGSTTGYVPEHRIWEQFQFTHRSGPFYSSQRFRLEQRFMARTAVVNNQIERDGFNFANRFRYFTRHILPFKKQASFRKGFYAAVQDEVFLNFGNTKNVNGKNFDQNRFYLALGYRFSAHLDIEAGYGNQYISGRAGSFTNNHIAQLAGYLRL
jgi:hypothetical protein